MITKLALTLTMNRSASHVWFIRLVRLKPLNLFKNYDYCTKSHQDKPKYARPF